MRAWLLIALTGLGCMPGSAVAAHLHGDNPVELVQNVTGFIFSDVAQNLETYTDNPEALNDMVREELVPLLDLNYAARLILGRAGRGLPDEKVEEFAEVMSELLINRYSKGLLYFSSVVDLTVLPQRGELNEKLTRVRTRVRLSSGADAPVDYAFRKSAAGWKAFDVIIEGISYVTTYRNQIMPEVQANGIDSVISRIRQGQMEVDE
ncbi:MAG: ABC transporter substrate-binding protein [Lysobacterales bacterium]|jgi:phospholipid transport system substrate-binding protein